MDFIHHLLHASFELCQTLMVGYFAWGRFAGRLGRGHVLLGCTAFTALYPALTAFAPSPIWLVPIAMVRGLTWSGIEVILLEAMIAKSPADLRPSFMAAVMLMENLALLVAPLIGTGIAALAGIQISFLIAAGLFLIVALFFKSFGFGEISEKLQRGR